MAHAQRAVAERRCRSVGALVALLALTGILGMHVVESRTAAPDLPAAAVAAPPPADAPAPPALVAEPDDPMHHVATCRSCVAPLALAVPLAPTPGGDPVAPPEHPLSSHPPDRSAPPP